MLELSGGLQQAAAESNAPLLQLPHVDYELVKKLSRKRVRSLAELAALDPVSRLDALTSAGALLQGVRLLRLRRP